MPAQQQPLSWIPELLEEIFMQTDISTLLTAQCVCHQWHNIIQNMDCVKGALFLARKCRTIKKLEQIHYAVNKVKVPFLDSISLPILSIKCEELGLKDCGTYNGTPEPCFFDPNVMVYPRDFDDEGDHAYRFIYQELGKFMKRTKRRSSASITSTLCIEMLREYFSWPRRHPDGDTRSLSRYGHWKLAEDWRRDWKRDAVLLPDLELSDLRCEDTSSIFCREPFWNVKLAFVSWGGERPHIMFVMRHEIDEGEDLLRDEVATISATILTRLERFACLYIPVLMFSFMGDYRGRIIHAYYDGMNIIIKKTKLYHFYPVEKARRIFDLFVRQMASEPIGDVKRFSGV